MADPLKPHRLLQSRPLPRRQSPADWYQTAAEQIKRQLAQLQAAEFSPLAIKEWNRRHAGRVTKLKYLELPIFPAENFSFNSPDKVTYLDNLNFGWLEFINPDFTNCCFNDCDFENTALIGGERQAALTFKSCNLKGLSLINQTFIMFKDEGSIWQDSHLSNCKFHFGACFERSKILDSSWYNVSLENASLFSASINNTKWDTVNWQGCEWRKSRLLGLSAKDSVVSQGEFKAVELVDLNWQGKWEHVAVRKSKFDGQFKGKWSKVSIDEATSLDWLDQLA
jgi:uncharacterized protein YjbI with pentapeptide repeats